MVDRGEDPFEAKVLSPNFVVIFFPVNLHGVHSTSGWDFALSCVLDI